MSFIFDLDGTLIDTRPGILYSLQQAIQQALPEVDITGLDFKIGPPVREMFSRTLKPISETELDSLETAFRASYDTSGWEMSKVYPGVVETLDYLYNLERFLFIATNKPRDVTNRILSHLGLLPFFEEIVCPDFAPVEIP